MKNTNCVSQYFNENWKRYQETINNNTLYHREMIAQLNTFLNTRLSHPFSFVDMGCGDCSTIAQVLFGKPLTHYFGVDAAPLVLQIASENLDALDCHKEFICDNMENAILRIPSPINLIYTAYAVHHLTHANKYKFIEACHHKLKSDGHLLMIDGVLNENQSRNEWLFKLEERIKTTQSISEEELAHRMQHPRKDDFPETISTFENMAKKQNWRHFEVLMQKDIFAFMVFSK